MKSQLDFDAASARKRNTRAPLAGFQDSKLRGIVEHNIRSHPAEVFYAYKYLPVLWVDETLEDGVVINKGTIVSVVTGKSGKTQVMGAFGEVADQSSIYLGTDYTGGAVSVSIDNDYFGYSDSVAGVLIPANGGVDVAPTGISLDQYSSLDTGRTIKPDGTEVSIAAGGSNENVPYTRSACYPVGAVTSDVYQDIRGRFLNYEVQDLRAGIVDSAFVEYPFVDMWAANSSGLGKNNPLAEKLEGDTADVIDPTATWYPAVVRDGFTFVYNPTVSNLLLPGALLKSDKYGMIVPEWGALTAKTATSGIGNYIAQTASIASGSTDALGNTFYLDQPYVTAQTIGRILVTDSRFSKDMQELVQTYPGSTMPGSDTGGLPRNLYMFARQVMIRSSYKTAAAITNTDILNAVQQGIFGLVRLELTLA